MEKANCLQIICFFNICVIFTPMIANISFAEFAKYTLISSWGSKGSADGQFNVPHSLAFNQFGNAYVTDTNNHRIQKFTSDGKFITKWGSEGSGDGQFLLPLGIGIDSSKNIYSVDQEKSTVQVFTKNGKIVPSKFILINKTNNNQSTLEDIEIDQFDNVYLTDRGEHDIKIFAIKK